MRLVWPRVVVGEGSLTQAISDIRRVLGDNDHRLVRNIARRGYMLVPESVPESVPGVAVAEPAASIAAEGATRTPRRRWILTSAFLLEAVLAGWVAWQPRPPNPNAGPANGSQETVGG